MNSIPRYRFMDIAVDALTQADLNGAIREAVDGGKSLIIATHNLHSAYLCERDPKMREFYAASKYVAIDGMSLIIAGRLLGMPLKKSNRLAMLDAMGPILSEAAAKRWRIFHLGNSAKVAQRGAVRLCARFPGLQLMVEPGYFDATPGSEDNRRILQAIRDFRPNILLVGMGMPRQERWVMQHLDQLSGMTIVNVGGYLAYVAGDVPTPPRWTGQLGLEWLFRLLSEPHRLWYRYLMEPWLLLLLFLKQQKRELRPD